MSASEDNVASPQDEAVPAGDAASGTDAGSEGVWPVDRLRPMLEAVLFAAGDPLPVKKINDILEGPTQDEVKAALEKLQISGMTVTEVRGHGKQKGHTAIYRGQEYNVSLLPKMEVEVVVPDTLADEAIKAIIASARTGEIGDGRVFVLPVLESYKIRTGERES